MQASKYDKVDKIDKIDKMKKNALLAMGRYGQTVGGDMCNVKT